MRVGLLAFVGALALVVSGAGANAAVNACPTTNRPNELVLAGGSNQTAQLGKPFSQPFSVQLANTNGCALTGNLAGVAVHFDAPGAGGPSGFFASSGSKDVTVGTDAQGVATAPTFTANDTAGSYSVGVDSDYGAVDLPVTNTATGLAAGVSVVTSTVQQASVGTLYAAPLQARVLDANGNPVQGATVAFTVVPGAAGAGGSFLASAQVMTGSDGIATAPPLLANGVAGAFMVTAATDGLSTIATFTLENLQTYNALVATPASHKVTVGGRYTPLVVHVVDATGQPVQGIAVTFSVDSSQGEAGATFLGGSAQATVTTDLNGVASSPALVAGKVSGSFVVVASAASARAAATFSLHVLAGKPQTVVAGAASGESTTVGTRFPVRFAVTVTDADGNAVPNARVTFVAPARGASGRFGRVHERRVTVKTDSHGIAVAPSFTANRKAGGYAVEATAGGRATAFAVMNLAR